MAISQDPFLEAWIHPFYLKDHKKVSLKKSFLVAKPFPYLELKNFLQHEKALQLGKALLDEPFYEKESDLFTFKQTGDIRSSSNSVLQSFRSMLSSKAFLDYLHTLTGLSFKAKMVDLAGTLYEDTDFLLCHDDELDERNVAFLFYLSTLSPRDGGSLNLFSSKKKLPYQVVRKIIPKFNTFTFFKVSSHSFHEIAEVIAEKKRFALGGWFHAQD